MIIHALISIVWVTFGGIYAALHGFSDISLNEAGDFFAGLFSPLAFYWLVVGFFMQRKELSLQREELFEARKQNERQADELSKHSRYMLDELEFQRKLQRKTAYDVYDKFADRMFQIRLLQISNNIIPKIWDGGPEGKVQETVLPEHFYFAKILFQTNEAIFLALNDQSIETEITKMDLEGWKNNFRTDLSAPIFSRIWTDFKHVRDSYSKDFQNVVDGILADINRETTSSDA